MGSRILKFKFWLLVLLPLLVFVFIAILGDFSNPRREIFFRYHNKVNFGFFIGYLPNSYYYEYEENTIEENKRYRLTSITYLKFPTEKHNYILFLDKESPSSEDILLDSDSVFWHYSGTSCLISSQINIETFNKYLKYDVSVKGERAIRELYYSFIGDYKIITSSSQISSFRKLKNVPNECYKLHNQEFEPDFEKYTYVWFDQLGLFEIKFIIKENKILTVEDNFIFGPLSLNVIETEPC